MKNFLKFVAINIALILGLTLSLGGFRVQAANDTTKTWVSSTDWSIWSKSNVAWDSIRRALALTKTGAVYKTSGFATYKYSPGGINRWKSYTSNSSGVTSSSNYTWLPIPEKGTVAQIDSRNGHLEKQWTVGIGPTRVASGLKGDVWVANTGTGFPKASLSDPQFTQKINSISHIIPDQDKVITKKVFYGDSSKDPRGIKSISVDKLNHIWVGMNNPKQLVVIDGNDFDNPESPTNIISSFALRDDPYGSVFDSGFENLYLTGIGAGITRIKINDLAKPDNSKLPAEIFYYSADKYGIAVYGMTNDNDGNIWAASSTASAGKIVLIDKDTKQLKTFDATFDDPLGQMCVGKDGKKILCNPVQVDTSGGNKLVVNLSGTDVIATADIIQMVNDAKLGQFNFSLPSNKITVNGASVVNSDTDGRQVSGSTGTISFRFSDREITSINVGETEISSVPDSQDLYIRINFTGTTTSTPYLNSLAVTYEDQGPFDAIAKTTYAENELGEQIESSSFEAGDKVIVELEIREVSNERSDFRIEDTVPSSISGQITYQLINPDGQSSGDQLTNVADGKIYITGSQSLLLKVGKNIIRYSYVIK